MKVNLGLVHKLEDVRLPPGRVADTVGDDVDLGLFLGNSVLAAKFDMRLFDQRYSLKG